MHCFRENFLKFSAEGIKDPTPLGRRHPSPLNLSTCSCLSSRQSSVDCMQHWVTLSTIYTPLTAIRSDLSTSVWIMEVKFYSGPKLCTSQATGETKTRVSLRTAFGCTANYFLVVICCNYWCQYCWNNYDSLQFSWTNNAAFWGNQL